LRWPHDSFEVIDSGEYWDVVGFNTDNPSVKVLANRCENRTYAEMLAADLNGLNDVEPANAASSESAAQREQLPIANFLSDSNGEPLRREIRFKV
jgi:hypothetical protein